MCRSDDGFGTAHYASPPVEYSQTPQPPSQPQQFRQAYQPSMHVAPPHPHPHPRPIAPPPALHPHQLSTGHGDHGYPVEAMVEHQQAVVEYGPQPAPAPVAAPVPAPVAAPAKAPTPTPAVRKVCRRFCDVHHSRPVSQASCVKHFLIICSWPSSYL